eukprot:CAMPEP_0197239470 /NCGR_PEP_ID=MMETSP1429-20130617/5934_1 /TAXON_ID=49237 /ORGANISM="Chaetoceros  sp., Strain UNC1202" /LENGTH=216 /DNA_ID=CAMNT_0042698891 /DNA_START=147 /DNA_END=797 /DNA_ORIENTATION=-
MNDDGEDVAPVTMPQPTPLDFDLNEIEGFRYRVEDVGRAVTRVAVQETRAAELKAEILNSQRLQNHFTENPSDLQLLRHDRVATHVSKVQDHLKNVPKYLLPRGMQVAATKKRKKRKRVGNKRGLRRTDNDPLQSFDGDNVNLDGVAEGGEEETGGDGADTFEDPMTMDDGDDEAADEQGDGLGKSTAGRNAWKEKRGRGKYSKKYQTKQKEAMGY